MTTGTDIGGLYRLLAWLSPSFPTGAFSYSHGLEAAASAGAVHNRTTLEAWVRAIMADGSGRMNADILCAAWRAAASGDEEALVAANERGLAYRPTAELALESEQQGAAFHTAIDAAWRNPKIEGCGIDAGHGVSQAAAVGAVGAWSDIALEDTLLGYLQAFAANLVSAALRLGIIGQTDGQRILAALEPVVRRAVEAAMRCVPADFGSATFAADLMSIAHETQYSRLFRS